MSSLAVLVALSVVAVAGALTWWVVAARRRRQEAAERLPAGADAALWSIVEAVPDPRNHLALTRDLTGEVRIAGTPLQPFRPEEHAKAS
jgi:Flp pilus assembly protein TadB